MLRARLLMSWMTPMTWLRAEIIGTVSIERVWYWYLSSKLRSWTKPHGLLPRPGGSRW
jgi:hypothetical protein